MFEMKNVAFWVKLHSFLNLCQCGVFSVTKVFFFFTNGVYRKLLTMFFITTICVYDFCEMLTVLVKKSTPCQGMIWIFPSKMLYFYTGFLVVLHNLTCEPWNAKEKGKSAALELLPGLACTPWTLRPSVLKKMTSRPASSFSLFILPRKCTLLTPSVNSKRF